MKTETSADDGSHRQIASFGRVIVSAILFLGAWIVTAAVVSAIVNLLFPAGGDPELGIGWSWRLLPGTVLGFLAGYRVWRLMIDDHVKRMRKKRGG